MTSKIVKTINKYEHTIIVEGNPSQLEKFNKAFGDSADNVKRSFGYNNLKKVDFFYQYFLMKLGGKGFSEMEYKEHKVEDLFTFMYANYNHLNLSWITLQKFPIDEVANGVFEIALKRMTATPEEKAEADEVYEMFLRSHTPDYSFDNLLEPSEFTKYRKDDPAIPSHLSYDEWNRETFGLSRMAMNGMVIELKRDKKSRHEYTFKNRDEMHTSAIKKISKQFPKLEFTIKVVRNESGPFVSKTLTNKKFKDGKEKSKKK